VVEVVVEEPFWFSIVWDSVLLKEPSTLVVDSVVCVVVVPSWFSTTVEVRWVTEPSSPIIVSVVVLALYSTWMSLVAVYPLYVAYTVMSPVWVMVMLPFASIVAHEPP
jgi:hypothetical protein